MSAHSLEAERQAILDRMQARRERYRRMLTDGTGLDEEVVVVEPRAVSSHAVAGQAARPAILHTPAGPTVYRAAPLSARHNPVVRAVMEHPMLVALGVAALVAVGPRRVLRTLTTGTTALSTLAVRNQSNVDLAGRLLTMVGAYVQGRSKDQPQ